MSHSSPTSWREQRRPKMFVRKGFQSFVLGALHHHQSNSSSSIIISMTTNSTKSVAVDLPSSLTGLPRCLLVPPGQCQLNDVFVTTKLLSRTPVSATSSVLRFQLPDPTKPLGSSTCACLLLGTDQNDTKNQTKENDGKTAPPTTTTMIIRPYTPISTNADIGTVDFLIKHYPGGAMSSYLQEIPVGDTSIQMKHIPFNVKIQAPFPYDHIVMLVGGTGITPMIQALHAILGAAADSEESSSSSATKDNKSTKVTMLYGSKTSDDILGSDLLYHWAQTFPDRFQLIDILSHEPEDSNWRGERGFIDQAKLEQYIPKVDGTTTNSLMIFVCGPPPMYNALCGPREEPTEIKGILGEMGFGPSQVYKF